MKNRIFLSQINQTLCIRCSLFIFEWFQASSQKRGAGEWHGDESPKFHQYVRNAWIICEPNWHHDTQVALSCHFFSLTIWPLTFTYCNIQVIIGERNNMRVACLGQYPCHLKNTHTQGGGVQCTAKQAQFLISSTQYMCTYFQPQFARCRL